MRCDAGWLRCAYRGEGKRGGGVLPFLASCETPFSPSFLLPPLCLPSSSPKENLAKPESERLPRSEFEIDPGLREMMEEETVKREEEAR